MAATKPEDRRLYHTVSKFMYDTNNYKHHRPSTSADDINIGNAHSSTVLPPARLRQLHDGTANSLFLMSTNNLLLSSKTIIESVNDIQTGLICITRHSSILVFQLLFIRGLLSLFQRLFAVYFHFFQRSYFLIDQSGSTISFRTKCLFLLMGRRYLHYYTAIPTVLVIR